MAPGLGSLIIEHYFPSKTALRLERVALIDMLFFRCHNDSIAHLVPTVREQFEKFVSSLNEGKLLQFFCE